MLLDRRTNSPTSANLCQLFLDGVDEAVGKAASTTSIIPEDEAIQPKSWSQMPQSKASAESGRARLEETEGKEGGEGRAIGGGVEEGAAADGSGRHGRFHRRSILGFDGRKRGARVLVSAYRRRENRKLGA